MEEESTKKARQSYSPGDNEDALQKRVQQLEIQTEALMLETARLRTKLTRFEGKAAIPAPGFREPLGPNSEEWENNSGAESCSGDCDCNGKRCYTCAEVGHISKECTNFNGPNRVARPVEIGAMQEAVFRSPVKSVVTDQRGAINPQAFYQRQGQ